MGLFDNISNVKPTFDANYAQAGEYVVQIESIRQDRSRKKVDFVATRVSILHVLKAEKDEAGQSVSHRVGEETTYMISDTSTAHDMFLPNVKAEIMQITLFPEHEVTAQACEDLVDPVTQPLAGIVCIMTAVMMETKGTKRPYTKVTFDGDITRKFCTDLGVVLPADAQFVPEMRAAATDAAATA